MWPPRPALTPSRRRGSPAGRLTPSAPGLAYHVVKPGQRGRAHRHDQAEEIYVVLSGSGRAVLDGEIIALRPMDAVRVAPSVARAFEADSAGLELLVFGAHHENDGEILNEDPWPES